MALNSQSEEPVHFESESANQNTPLFFVDMGNTNFLIDSIQPLAMGARRPTENCNTSIDFEVDQLEPIIDELTLVWPDWPQTEDNLTVWEKEWRKHGSCIVDEVPDLSNELDYFTQGKNAEK